MTTLSHSEENKSRTIVIIEQDGSQREVSRETGKALRNAISSTTKRFRTQHRNLQHDICFYCGDRFMNYSGDVQHGLKYRPKACTLDHIFPLSQTNIHSFDSCVASCYTCNCHKRDEIIEIPALIEHNLKFIEFLKKHRLNCSYKLPYFIKNDINLIDIVA